MNFSYGAHNKIYWKCLHIICSCYDAVDIYDKTEDHMKAMLGFIKMFAILVPNKQWSRWMIDFIEMCDKVKFDVLSNDRLRVYYNSKSPMRLEHYIMTKNSSALEWSWGLHEYINYKRRCMGENIMSKSLQELKDHFNIKHITKDAWGRPMWFVLHTFSLYSEPLTPYLQKVWKAFVSSLQYVLPCPICREHVRQNMIALDIGQFLSSPKKLFEWTWRLHNTVNLSKDYKTRAISLQEAEEIYTNMDEQQLNLIFL